MKWDKWVWCDYLPDPEDEKDLQTQLRIWEEKKDKAMQECISDCQISEDVSILTSR